MTKRKTVKAKVSKTSNLKNLIALFVFFLLLLGIVIIVKKYQGDSIKVDFSLKKEEKKETENITTNDSENKIEKWETKYNNPKRATLRRKNWERVGKVFMQFDKDENKTYFWVRTDGLEKGDYNLVLVNKKLSEEEGKNLSVGKISFDDKGNGYFSYEFEKEGNWYDYLKVVVLDDDEEFLEANFSEKLS